MLLVHLSQPDLSYYFTCLPGTTISTFYEPSVLFSVSCILYCSLSTFSWANMMMMMTTTMTMIIMIISNRT